MTYPIGRGVRLEVQASVSANKTISAITLANPGVATSTSHGLTDGTCGYFSTVVGMVQLEGQAVRINAPATNTFELETLDTTSYSAFTSGNFTPVATWSTIAAATNIDIGGGAADKLDQTRLIDDIRQEVIGLLPAQSIKVDGLSDFTSAAMLIVNAAAINSTPLVFRVTHKNGEQRVFRGIPSLASESIPVGGNATGSFDISVSGRVLFLP